MQKEIIAKFFCAETFSITDLNYFVMNGNLMEGKVQIGQYVNFICPDYKRIVRLKISNIQCSDDMRNKKTKLDIAVACANREELNILDEIKISNETCFITNN